MEARLQEQLEEQNSVHTLSLRLTLSLCLSPSIFPRASSKTSTTQQRGGDVEGRRTWIQSPSFTQRKQAGDRKSECTFIMSELQELMGTQYVRSSQHHLLVSTSSLPSMACLWTPWNTMQLPAGVHTNTNVQPGSLTPGLCCPAAARN